MIKIITAIGEPFINEKLSKEKEIKIIGKDILYQEAVFEIIENNKINFLIINENIFENSEIIKIIKKIKEINNKIKIIIIINKEKNIIKKLNKEKNTYIIFYNKKIKEKIDDNNLIKIIKLIIQNRNTEKYFEINEQRKKNKKVDITLIKNSIKEKMDKQINGIKKYRRKELSQGQIITVIGEENVGKSTIVAQHAKRYQKKNQGKILIVDFNIFNQKLYSKFQKRKYPKKIYQRLVKNNFNKDRPKVNYKKIFDDFKIKINNNIDLISGLDLIFKNNKKINKKLIIEELKKEKNKYKIIIIDTSSKDELNLNNFLLKISTKILLIIEPNLLEIKKGKNIIKNIKSKNEDSIKKINIIVNKYNNKSIDFYIIKNIFKGIKVVKMRRRKLYERRKCITIK